MYKLLKIPCIIHTFMSKAFSFIILPKEAFTVTITPFALWENTFLYEKLFHSSCHKKVHTLL